MNKKVLKLYIERSRLMQKSEKTGIFEYKVIKQYGRVTDSVTAENNKYNFRYYDTLICAIDEDKRTIRFNTGGWHTKTTKERLNAICSLLALGRRVSIKKGTFIWSDGKDFIEGETFTF